jgi:hypothetical protein
MRFYGIPSEDRALELLAGMPEGRWVFVENFTQTELDLEQVREKTEGDLFANKGLERGQQTHSANYYLYFCAYARSSRAL